MSDDQENSDGLYFKNKDRQENPGAEPYQPEHERLNKHPVPPELRKLDYMNRKSKLSQDFKYAKEKSTLKYSKIPLSGSTDVWDNQTNFDPHEEFKAGNLPKFPAPFVSGAPMEDKMSPMQEGVESVFKLVHEAPSEKILVFIKDEVFVCNTLEQASNFVDTVVNEHSIDVHDISVCQKLV